MKLSRLNLTYTIMFLWPLLWASAITEGVECGWLFKAGAWRLLLSRALSAMEIIILQSCFDIESVTPDDRDRHLCFKRYSQNFMSMCCALSRTFFPNPCRMNGLCTGGRDKFCNGRTDPTWKNPLRLQLFTRGEGNRRCQRGCWRWVVCSFG